MINIAILGYGTVGSGVFQVLKENNEIIKNNVGDDVNVKYILDLRDFPGDPAEDKIVHNYEKILADPEIKVVVEVMGGINPAYDFVRAALESGKSVCTSNKELVEKHGTELIKIAKDSGLNFLFGASVGGGIPIIRTIAACLTADEIVEVSGILNGTTNYMLTRMYEDGASYEDVLKEAQELGYAEANPTADVEGHDACRKIAILTSMISGNEVNYEDIYCEGITKITRADIAYAKALNSKIKLVAMSKKVDNAYSPMVAPFIVKNDHPLYTVDGAFNSVYINGNMLGDAMFYGSGAGKYPTASAVCADVVGACRNLNRNLTIGWKSGKQELVPFEEIKRCFLIRFSGKASDYIEQLVADFGDIKTIENIAEDEFAIETQEISEKLVNEKVKNYFNIKNMLRIL